MNGENGRSKKRGYVVVAAIVIIVLLAISVPIQYLVRRDVVVGLASEYAHSHAHEHEDEAVHEHEDEDEDEHEHEHDEGEEHYAEEVSLGVNLIPNYGFEVGTYEQIWGWSKLGEDQGSHSFRDDTLSRRGLASAAVDTMSFEVEDVGWIMRLDELPLDHKVIFDAHIKAKALEGEAYLLVVAQESVEGEDAPNVLALAPSGAVSGDDDWSLCEAQLYIPPETTDVWLAVLVSGRGKAWFDDVSLEVYEPDE